MYETREMTLDGSESNSTKIEKVNFEFEDLIKKINERGYWFKCLTIIMND